MPKEIYDEKLDRLYNKNVKCPYCKTMIRKYTAVCENCGVHKKQISDASSSKAKEAMKKKTGEKIVMTTARPNDLSFTKMSLYTVFLGWLGIHNFVAGRKVRGWIILSFVIIYVLFMIIFPMSLTPDGDVIMHPIRETFEQSGILFPTDFLGVAAIIMWWYDIFLVVIGWYKYPVRLGEKTNA